MRLVAPNHGGDLQPDQSLLVGLCSRNAAPAISPAHVALLGAAAFRRKFVDLAARHRVLGLALVALDRAGKRLELPASAREEFRTLLGQLRRRSAIFGIKRDRILACLEAAGVRPVLLKGAALGYLLYQDPVERDLQDLDLLVGAERVDPALRALTAEGYTPRSAPGLLAAYRRHHFHVPLYHPDTHAVEIHWALAMPDSPFQLDPGVVRHGATPLEQPGLPLVYLPRAEHILLHLVLQNIQEGFSRLARLVDIDRLATETPEPDWPALAAVARDGGLAAPTALSLQLASRLLLTPLPDGILRELRPAPATRLHLAILRPVPNLLRQRMVNRHTAHRLLEFWLLDGVRKRIRLLRRMLLPDLVAQTFDRRRLGALRRVISVGKLAVLHVVLYLAAAASLATPSGWAQMRFWSSQARSSERL